MTTKSRLVALSLLGALGLLSLPSMPTWAQVGMSTANGKIEDSEGNPIQGARVSFYAASAPDRKYSGKTNKKGRYNIGGLYSAKEGDRWHVELEAEGWIPTSMYLESRTGTRTLLGDPMTVKLNPGQKIPDFVIRPLGSARVDFVVGSQAEIEERLAAERDAALAAQAEELKKKESAARAANPYENALTLVSEGALAESIPWFDKALEEKPDEGERYQRYAQVLYKLERYDEAEVQGNKAVELLPDSFEAQMVLYSVHVGKRSFVKANQQLDRALAIDPDNTDVWAQKAFVASETGDAAGQVAAYEKITEIDPSNGEAWAALGGLYAEAGDNDKSAAAYEKVTELDPESAPQVFFNLGALYSNRGEAAKAIDAFSKAVEMNPDYAAAQRELALAKLNSGDRAGAIEGLQAYFKLAPDAEDVARLQQLVEMLQK